MHAARHNARMHKLPWLALLLAATMPHAAEDLHAYWDDRCKGCHGDSGDFARRTLRVEDGLLKGTHHQGDLSLFLRRHYLADGMVAPVQAMLMAQASSAPLFKTRCGDCHGAASTFARESLALRGGVLVGKAEGQPVADTLRRHGGLPPAEQAAMVDILRRVLGEVSRAD
jgi:mono/diheme cytochrome c family protein